MESIVPLQARILSRSWDEDMVASSFQSSLVITYQADECGSIIPSSDISILANTILYTYNGMLATENSDPIVRTISHVSFKTYQIEPDTGIATVEFTIAGTCRGCDPDIVTLFNDGAFTSTGNKELSGDRLHGPGSLLPDDLSPSTRTHSVTNRARTEKEFLQVYNSALLENSNGLTCVTRTLPDGIVSTQPSWWTPSRLLQINCTTDANLTTALTSEVLVKTNENASQSSLEELGQDLVETYNALMDEIYGPCNTTTYRQITNISVISSTTSSKRNMRHRILQDVSLSETIFRLDGFCDGCDSAGIFFDPDVVSNDNFVEYYYGVVGDGLAYLSEIERLDCPSNITTFEDLIIVEFVPDDLYSDSLVNDEVLVQKLEELYVDAYNQLALEYCDPIHDLFFLQRSHSWEHKTLWVTFRSKYVSQEHVRTATCKWNYLMFLHLQSRPQEKTCRGHLEELFRVSIPFAIALPIRLQIEVPLNLNFLMFIESRWKSQQQC